MPMGAQESRIQACGNEVRKFSHFPSNDVKEWCSYFNTHFPDGYMTQKGLEDIFLLYFPFGSVTKFTSRLFQTINIGQTGLVDFNELLIAFSILVKGSNFEKLRWIFRFYDKDRDGVVSKEEMKDAIEDLLDMVRETLDININSQSCVNSIFESLENQSGFLTFNDFERLGEIHGDNFSVISIFVD
jgi:neuronal calcium sensor 1